MDSRERSTDLWIERGVRLGELCKRIAARLRGFEKTLGQTLDTARDAGEPTHGEALHRR